MSIHSETQRPHINTKTVARDRRAGGCVCAVAPQRAREWGSTRARGRRTQLGAPARTVPNRELRRGSCARSASTRPRGTRRAAGRAMQWWRCANVDSGCAAVAWHDGRFQTGGTSAQRPQPARSSRRAGAISACHAAAAWLDERIGTTHRPTCTEPAINACPARRSSGTSSRFGADMGVRPRTGE